MLRRNQCETDGASVCVQGVIVPPVQLDHSTETACAQPARKTERNDKQNLWTQRFDTPLIQVISVIVGQTVCYVEQSLDPSLRTSRSTREAQPLLEGQPQRVRTNGAVHTAAKRKIPSDLAHARSRSFASSVLPLPS